MNTNGVLALVSAGLLLAGCSADGVTAPGARAGLAPTSPRFAIGPAYTSAAGITPTTVLGNINTVENACGSSTAGFKIDNSGGGYFLGVTVTTGGAAGNQYVAWEADAGVHVTAVFVKGGDSYNRYIYPFPADPSSFTRLVTGGAEYYKDADLVSPNNNGGNTPTISHTIVCVGAGGTGSGDPDAYLSVKKFYDANANGINDGDAYIDGWQVVVAKSGFSAIVLTPFSGVVLPGEYTITESTPIQTNWFHTTENPLVRTIGVGQRVSVEFGNVCVGAGGGLTLGFWSNKNGESILKAGDNFSAALTRLSGLNLVDGTGAAFNPSSYAKYRGWLLAGTATNMAYMLSVQLSAMSNNVTYNKVSGSALIYAPGTTSANAAGFATVNAVMAEANAELALHPNTTAGTAGEAYRTYQEALKNALDRANNNLNFVQSSATNCPYTFPTLAPAL